LKDIVAAIDNPSCALANDLPNWEAAFTLIAAHIFRYPGRIPAEWFSFFDYFALSDLCHEPGWPHISLVYDFGVGFVKRMTCDSAEKVHICGDLLKLAVYLARTPDDREQQKLVLFFLAIYENVLELRDIAWQVVSSALARILYDDEPFVAAKPLLCALATIIGGFRKPLNDQHLPFFHDILLPLHRNQYLVYFAKELLSCVCQYLEKDPSLVVHVFRTVMRYWPRLQPTKQLIMLDEVALFSSFVEEEWLIECVHIVCPQLLSAIAGCNSWVSEKALSMWEVNDFVWFMTTNPGVTFPIVLPRIHDVVKFYWAPEIRLLATAVLRTMQANDQRVFDIVGVSMTKIQSLELIERAGKASRWKYLITNFEENEQIRRVKMRVMSRLFEGVYCVFRAKKRSKG
jgi:serine/threonine-protein phosphatase 2A regulatory subunit B'